MCTVGSIVNITTPVYDRLARLSAAKGHFDYEITKCRRFYTDALYCDSIELYSHFPNQWTRRSLS